MTSNTVNHLEESCPMAPPGLDKVAEVMPPPGLEVWFWKVGGDVSYL